MNVKDLEAFLIIAKTENMQLAANYFEKSPSMMSKSLKRLESTLNTPLFDRVGKRIELNDTGKKFQLHAAKILAQTKQSIAECSSSKTEHHFRIAAPSILYFRWASVITKVLLDNHIGSAIEFETHYEQHALNQLKRGYVDLAIVTSAITEQLTPEFFVAPLGKLRMKVAAGKSHPLASCAVGSTSVTVSTNELLQHNFVAPNISPYCGENRGVGCDGWQDNIHPRKLTLIANDYAVLGQIVKSGQALAFLPDFWIRELGLVSIDTDECYHCEEKILLVGQQAHLVDLFLAS